MNPPTKQNALPYVVLAAVVVLTGVTMAALASGFMRPSNKVTQAERQKMSERQKVRGE